MLISFDLEREGDAPAHVVVLVNGRIYRLDTVDSSGRIFTPPQLESALSEIKSHAIQKGSGIGLSSLTGDNRMAWYHVSQSQDSVLL